MKGGRPPGITQIDGDWGYDEFAGDGGVKALDLDEPEASTEAPAAGRALNRAVHRSRR